MIFITQGSICIFFSVKREIFDKVHTRPKNKNVPLGGTQPSQWGRMYRAQTSLRFRWVPASVRFWPDQRVAPWMTPTLTGKRERTHGTVVGKVLPVLPCYSESEKESGQRDTQRSNVSRRLTSLLISVLRGNGHFRLNLFVDVSFAILLILIALDWKKSCAGDKR